MHRALLLASIALGACSTNPAPAKVVGNSVPVHGVTAGHKCETAGTDEFIGQRGTSETGAAIRRASRAALIRWSPPGYMLTMDYREDRVTVWLDPDYTITKISCG